MHRDIESMDIQREYPCSMCNFTCIDENEFKFHLETDHGKNNSQNYSCFASDCDFKGNDSTKFNCHLKSHKHYQCTGCGNNFHGSSSKTLFKMHLDNMKSKNIENACSGKHVINCDLCNDSFEEEIGFKTHFARGEYFDFWTVKPEGRVFKI